MKIKDCNTCGIDITEDNCQVRIQRGKEYVLPHCRTCYLANERSYQRNRLKDPSNRDKHDTLVKQTNSTERRKELRRLSSAKFAATIAGGFYALEQECDRNGIKNCFTKETYAIFLESAGFKCYYTGRDVRNKPGYHLDRAGLIECGGDGVKGGEYSPRNCVVALYTDNYQRLASKETVEEYREYNFGRRMDFNSPRIYKTIKRIGIWKI